MSKYIIPIITFVLGALLASLIGIKMMVGEGQLSLLSSAKQASTIRTLLQESPSSVDDILKQTIACDLERSLELQAGFFGHSSQHTLKTIEEIMQNWGKQQIDCRANLSSQS